MRIAKLLWFALGRLTGIALITATFYGALVLTIALAEFALSF